MAAPTPFHARTQALCASYAWTHWSGYYAVRHFDESPEREYNAIRQGAGLQDVTPLFKYDITGDGAGDFLSYVLAKSVRRLSPGRITYACWTDDAGQVIDDGTVWRVTPTHYRLTAAVPTLRWLQRHAGPFDVDVDDVTDAIAALSLQGPTAREILGEVCDADLGGLRFFRHARARFEGGFEATISRTGYTGDLGYELWVAPEHALTLWDALMARGEGHGVWPIGLDALDVARVEAGFIMQGPDYTSAHDADAAHQTSSPYELNLGWTVQLDRPRFIGQDALRREADAGSAWAFVGLEIDWDATIDAFARFDLAPNLPPGAWRGMRPLYAGMRQIGRATSGAWSPLLKQNLALATVERAHASPGTTMDIELTVAWERLRVPATVRALPWFDPPRKRANAPAASQSRRQRAPDAAPPSDDGRG